MNDGLLKPAVNGTKSYIKIPFLNGSDCSQLLYCDLIIANIYTIEC